MADYNRARVLIEVGVSDQRIALRTGIPRSTVRDWRRRVSAPRSRRMPRNVANWRPPEPAAYAYLLGLFLGDGCLIRRGRASPQLVLTLDARYPEIIGDAVSAIRTTVPGINVPRAARPGCLALLASHPVWATAFPQGMARGRKHQRRIELMDWQRELTHDCPTSLLRGLIHSDGCRSVNRFRTRLPSGRVREYSYVRYFFTNYSADIRRIFSEHCDLVGIRWTQSSFKNISVAHRDSVALLDRFVGPKR